MCLRFAAGSAIKYTRENIGIWKAAPGCIAVHGMREWERDDK
jgi:hypothetical protein